MDVLAPDRLLAFTIIATVLVVIPGPSVLFVISRALAFGRRTALTSVLGGAVGAYTLVIAVALGVGTIVAQSAVVFTALKWIGAAYLVYLGVRTFRHRRDLAAAMATAADPVGDRRAFRQGFVVGVTNPKTAVFFAAMLPQFVDPGRGHATLQLLLLGLVFVAIVLVSDSLWGLVAGTARAWFARSARRMEVIGGVGGLAIIGLGLHVAATGRKD